MSGPGRGRVPAFCCAALLLAATTAACSPRSVGAIDIARDDTGLLVVVLDGCGEDLDELTLSRTRDGGPTATAENGRLLYDRSDVAAMPVSGEGAQVITLDKVGMIEDGWTYSVGAWDRGRTVSAGPIRFTADDLAQADAGFVVRPGAPAAAEPMTVEQWLAAPCKDKR